MMLSQIRAALLIVAWLAVASGVSHFDRLRAEESFLGGKMDEDLETSFLKDATNHLATRSTSDDLDKLEGDMEDLKADLEDVLDGLNDQTVRIRGLKDLRANKTVQFCWGGVANVCGKTSCCNADCRMGFRFSLYHNYPRPPSVMMYLQSHDRSDRINDFSSFGFTYSDTSRYSTYMEYFPTGGARWYAQLWLGFFSCA